MSQSMGHDGLSEDYWAAERAWKQARVRLALAQEEVDLAWKRMQREQRRFAAAILKPPSVNPADTDTIG